VRRQRAGSAHRLDERGCVFRAVSTVSVAHRLGERGPGLVAEVLARTAVRI
jgi:hypothetical protein